MMQSCLIHCREFVSVSKAAWDRFWFQPHDPTPLSILRIVAGLLAFEYLLSLTPDLTHWFGASGALPYDSVRELLSMTDEAGTFYGYTYLRFCKTDLILYIAHAMGLVIVGAFTLGWYTRISAVLTWVVLLNYIHRAPMLTSQLEPVLTMLIAYLCLGPCGARWSLDARRADSVRRDSLPVASVSANLALRLIQLHTVGFYLLMGISKLGGVTWWSGEALWWLIAQQDSPLVDLTLIRNTPWVLQLLTHLIVFTELFYAVFIFNRWLRPFAVALACGMWMLLALATGRLPFCLLMIGLNAAFLPIWVSAAADHVPRPSSD